MFSHTQDFCTVMYIYTEVLEWLKPFAQENQSKWTLEGISKACHEKLVGMFESSNKNALMPFCIFINLLVSTKESLGGVKERRLTDGQGSAQLTVMD